MTITINVTTKHLPALKQAARELDIDLISDVPDGEYVSIHVLIFDYYQLILLGHIAGMNSSYANLKNPLGEMVSDLERTIESAKKKQNDKTSN